MRKKNEINQVHIFNSDIGRISGHLEGEHSGEFKD